MTSAVADLVGHREAFVAFVARRVGGDRALAEELVQDALVRNLERVDEIRDSAVGWFYRVLRNAVVDRARRNAVQQKRLDAFAAELELGADREQDREACSCIGNLVPQLAPDHAQAIQRVDLDGMAVKDYAAEAGITASNAGVRLFRARAALRDEVMKCCGTCAKHGCVDCSC